MGVVVVCPDNIIEEDDHDDNDKIDMQNYGQI